METEYDLSKLRELLPNHALLDLSRTKQGNLAIDVKITPSIGWQAHQPLIDKIIALFGEDLMEVYTEEQGYWFIIYLYRSKKHPTVIKF